MGQIRTWTICIKCGAKCPKWRNRHLVHTCEDCTVTAMVENANGIRTRTGPAYERWKAGMITYAERLRS